MSKSRRVMIATACVAMLCVVIVAFLPTRENKPFANLNVADITSVRLTVEPPGKTVAVDDIPTLVGYLRELITYEPDDSYSSYAGQSVQFILTMKDGTQKTVNPGNPFLIINGTGYRTEYEPCEALNHYANILVDSPWA